MGRTILFDLRTGGGSVAETVHGELRIEATMLHKTTTALILPAPTVTGISNGKATLTDVIPTPTGPTPAWAYRITVRRSTDHRSWSFLVAVPEGTSPINFTALVQLETVSGQDFVDMGEWMALYGGLPARMNSVEAMNLMQNMQLLGHGQRLDALDQLGGLTPGEPTDATVAAIVANIASTTRGLLDETYGTTTGAKPVAKGELVINVLDWGVINDPLVDSSTAFQNALDLAAGIGVVYIPPGVEFGLAHDIRWPAKTIVMAYGAWAHRLPGLGNMFKNWLDAETSVGGYDGRGNIHLRGLNVDAHGDTITSPINAVTFDHARDITCEDMIIRRSRGYHGLEFNAIDGFRAENIRFEGFAPMEGLDEKEALQVDCALPGDSGLADGTMARNGIIRNIHVVPYGLLPAHAVGVGSHTAPAGEYYENITVEHLYTQGCSVRAVGAYRWKHSHIDNVHSIDSVMQAVRAVECDNLKLTNSTSLGATLQGFSFTTNTVRSQMIGNYAEGATEGFYLGSGCAGNIIGQASTKHTKSYAITVNGGTDNLLAVGILDGAGYSTGALGAIRITGASKRTGITGMKTCLHGAGIEVGAGISISADSLDTWAFGNDFKGLAMAISGIADTSPNRI